MTYSERVVNRELTKEGSRAGKGGVKLILLAVKVLLVALLFVVVLGSAAAFGAVRGVIDSAPKLDAKDVAPKGLETVIYDSGGNVIQKLVASGANRELITYEDLPKCVIDAFVSIEDERFWTHEGIDLKGILRAGVLGIVGGFNFTEGASTLTQQLIKNNVFNGGSEKTLGARFVRKIQEQSLALQIEQELSKEEIITDYLNTINLGANCLGVQKAAERYFDKDVSELTLSEAAVIAAITQNPYAYNPITHPDKNATRREKVLKDMEEQGYITKEEREEALADDVYTRIAEVNYSYQQTTTTYSYFVDRLISDVLKDLQTAGYTYSQAKEMLYSGGLQIYSTQDTVIQAVLDEEINNPDNYEGVQKKFSFTYSLRSVHTDGTYTDYTEKDIKSEYNRTYLDFDSEEEIKELIEKFKDDKILSTDKITIENLDISLQPQVSAVLMDQSSGYVRAITGGRGEKTASLSLNRATSTMRQPGSTFKVLASFAPALEFGGATLATSFYDEVYSVGSGDQFWSPKNWYSGVFAGYADIRQGIVYSMNIIAAKCLVEKVGVQKAFDMVESFGINTLIPQNEENKVTGLNDLYPTLALGGITQGVTNLQLTAAYAAIANEGTYIKPILYTKILDENGKLLIDNTSNQETHQVVSAETAYLLTDAMSDSVEDTSLNGLFNSSSSSAKIERIPCAGKSGTTNSYNDLWFVGYTPYYTMGIWSGFDDNAKFTGSDDRGFHKVIWKKVMEKVTGKYAYTEFRVPDDIVECEICTKSGLLATDACAGDGRECIVTTEYFKTGTEPTEECNIHHMIDVCTDTGLVAGENCTNVETRVYIDLPEDSTTITDDSVYDSALIPTEGCITHNPGWIYESPYKKEETQDIDNANTDIQDPQIIPSY